MNKDIEYYTFQYTIPIYKIKPPQEFCDYYQTHKDEIIVELDKEKQQLQQKVNQLEANWNELKQWLISNDVYYPEAILFRETLHKMRELEGGSNE